MTQQNLLIFIKIFLFHKIVKNILKNANFYVLAIRDPLMVVPILPLTFGIVVVAAPLTVVTTAPLTVVGCAVTAPLTVVASPGF